MRRAGFDVVGVDILDCSKAYNRGPGSPEHENPARFVQADALTYPLEGFDLICASPPCQAHSTLRHLVKGKEYPNLIPQTRERLRASGIPYVIENVPRAPLQGRPLVLCGSMFGLETPDGRAELRRHRHFETSFPVTLRPECRHGKRVCIVTGHTPQDQRAINERRRKVVCVGGGKAMSGGMSKSTRGEGIEEYESRRAVISVTGATPQRHEVHNVTRETFSVEEARAAMDIPWMAMKDLSQAIPPVYSEFIGLLFLGLDPTGLLVEKGCQASLF